MAAAIAIRLDPNRFERILCATRPLQGPTLVEELHAAGVRVLSLKRSSRGALWAWQPFVKLLRRERIDIVHAHMFGSNVWGVLYGRLTGVPVIVAHEQSWSFADQPLRRLLDRWLIAARADVFLAVSREDRRRMIEIEHIPPNRVRVLPNAIPALRPSGGDVRHELTIAPDTPVVGTVCELRPEKRLDVLVSCAALLRARVPSLRVLIAGDGPEEARLRAQIRQAGLDDTVTLLGTRRDVPDLLAALDVAVCCSDFEGTPLSVMEYMAAGKPVVATRVGGLPELIDHEVHGLLVDRRNAEELARGIEVLLLDGERRAAMGARGRERQRREFDIDSMIGRLESLYEALYLATPRGRAEQGWA